MASGHRVGRRGAEVRLDRKQGRPHSVPRYDVDLAALIKGLCTWSAGIMLERSWAVGKSRNLWDSMQCADLGECVHEHLLGDDVDPARAQQGQDALGLQGLPCASRR